MVGGVVAGGGLVGVTSGTVPFVVAELSVVPVPVVVLVPVPVPIVVPVPVEVVPLAFMELPDDIVPVPLVPPVVDMVPFAFIVVEELPLTPAVVPGDVCCCWLSCAVVASSAFSSPLAAVFAFM